MSYYELQYWPYDTKGNDIKYWLLEEFPKEWAENTIDEVQVLGYYGHYDWKWYLVEIEEESPILAFKKAWKLISSVTDGTTKECRYGITYLTDDSEGELERDWSIVTLPSASSHDLGCVYTLKRGFDYGVEIISPDVVTAFSDATLLIDLFVSKDKE